MPVVFSYGSLQEEDVQLSTFGRLLDGERDDLPEFEQSLVPVDDPALVAATATTHTANVTFNGDDDSRVAGMALELTDPELAKCDDYEIVFSYRRVSVVLASGRRAWVYVHAPAEA